MGVTLSNEPPCGNMPSSHMDGIFTFGRQASLEMVSAYLSTRFGAMLIQPGSFWFGCMDCQCLVLAIESEKKAPSTDDQLTRTYCT